MRAERILAAGVLFWVVELACAAVVGGVRDPGVRGGPSGAGTALAGADVVYFAEASAAFREVHSILGSLGPAPGLGPRFNGTSCGGFHAQPAPGGSSPRRNPQFVMAAAHGGRNKIPSFLAPDGPVRVARDKVKPDGALVRLFTISGRSDAGNCVVAQPDFSDGENLCVRIPTPAFGAGLIENIPESAIRADQAAEAHTKRELGIFGKPNINADGAIGRFGWKAQHASLLHFSGEVYQIEMAVPNEVFYPQQESLPEICLSLYQDVRTTTLPTITNLY